MVTQDRAGHRLIRYADGRGTAGTGTVIGDRMYGHLPLLLHPEPRNILQICFGVGNSLAAVLRHPVERVDAVELSPGVLEAAPYFVSSNRDSMNDSRVNMIINDGRNFLLTSDERYDVIRLDPRSSTPAASSTSTPASSTRSPAITWPPAASSASGSTTS